MLKKIIAITLVVLSLAGCKTCYCDEKQQASSSTSLKAFNDENYVWENFYFTTNNTTTIIK